MSDDFLCQVQCDEFPYQPKEEDWLEYQQWLDSLPDTPPQPEGVDLENEILIDE